MGKVRIRMGESEVEIDSRDFYVDNQSIGQVIADVAGYLRDNSARLVYRESADTDRTASDSNPEYMQTLNNIEVHEPEFNNAKIISVSEVRSKIQILERDMFFDRPRTVPEIVSQLHEYGWVASPLDVAKTLTKMVFCRHLTRDSQNNKNYYTKAVIRL